MADPVGTIRREDHDGGYSIYIRMDPGYPDNQFANTEWTCIWSSDSGNIGGRCGTRVETAEYQVIGQVPGTPAYTGSDCSIGDRVEISPKVQEFMQGDVLGEIVAVKPADHYYGMEGAQMFGIQPTSSAITFWFFRRDFDLVEGN